MTRHGLRGTLRRLGTRLPSRRGAIALVGAMCFAFIGGFCGFAVDTTRVWLVRSRLKTSLAAAVLVSARQMADPQRDAQARSIFWANYGNPTYLGASVGTIAITPIGTDAVRVSASVTLP